MNATQPRHPRVIARPTSVLALAVLLVAAAPGCLFPPPDASGVPEDTLGPTPPPGTETPDPGNPRFVAFNETDSQAGSINAGACLGLDTVPCEFSHPFEIAEGVVGLVVTLAWTPDTTHDLDLFAELYRGSDAEGRLLWQGSDEDGAPNAPDSPASVASSAEDELYEAGATFLQVVVHAKSAADIDYVITVEDAHLVPADE